MAEKRAERADRAIPQRIRVLELATLFVHPYPNNPSLTLTRVFDPAVNPIVTDPADIRLLIDAGTHFEELS